VLEIIVRSVNKYNNVLAFVKRIMDSVFLMRQSRGGRSATNRRLSATRFLHPKSENTVDNGLVLIVYNTICSAHCVLYLQERYKNTFRCVDSAGTVESSTSRASKCRLSLTLSLSDMFFTSSFMVSRLSTVFSDAKRAWQTISN
jgi:hypothetical protein